MSDAAADAEVTFDAYIKGQRDKWAIPVECHSQAWSESLRQNFRPVDPALESSFQRLTVQENYLQLVTVALKESSAPPDRALFEAPFDDLLARFPQFDVIGDLRAGLTDDLPAFAAAAVFEFRRARAAFAGCVDRLGEFQGWFSNVDLRDLVQLIAAFKAELRFAETIEGDFIKGVGKWLKVEYADDPDPNADADAERTVGPREAFLLDLAADLRPNIDKKVADDPDKQEEGDEENDAPNEEEDAAPPEQGEEEDDRE
jgi:hypothetical protein